MQPVVLDELLVRGQELVSAGYVHRRRFDEAQAVHAFGSVGSQLQRDSTAVGQPHHVRAINAQLG